MSAVHLVDSYLADAVEFISADHVFHTAKSADPLDAAPYSFILQGRFLDLFAGWLDGMRDNLPPKDVVLSVASQAYDKLVVWVDIPGVPEIAESYVEKALKPFAMNWVSAIYDRLSAVPQ